MEEGHFDKEGTYIFGKRDKDEIKDHWLDNIDWLKVNNQQPTTSKNSSDEESMDASEYLKKFDPIPVYKEMLNILLPGESVLKALKRLGGGKVQTASERWKKKKQLDEKNSKTDEINKENIAKLTEQANSILTNMGNMDIYQETFEGIRHKVRQAEEKTSSVPTVSADLDMFGDMFDDKTKESTRAHGLSIQSSQEGEPTPKKVRFNEEENETAKEDATKTNSVQWEFKWENDDKAEIHGPHSSSEMQDWVNNGYFESGVWVRRIGQHGDFYTSRRIDFELYL